MYLHMSARMPLHMSLHMATHMSTCLSTRRSVCMSRFTSVQKPICMYTHARVKSSTRQHMCIVYANVYTHVHTQTIVHRQPVPTLVSTVDNHAVPASDDVRLILYHIHTQVKVIDQGCNPCRHTCLYTCLYTCLPCIGGTGEG